MPQCPSCDATFASGATRCPACGDVLPTTAAPAVTAVHRSSHGAAGSGNWMPGDVLGGRYRLVALLGRGGMGEVYRADDLKLRQTVALKCLPATLANDPDMLARFYAEVRIGRTVSHPNVCRLHDLIEIEGRPVLSMEFVDGEDLSALLKRIGRLPEGKAIEFARELCAGLAAAHEKGVIHRDLKPANIMIDGRGQARIADFGVAALADGIDREATAGTPAYMAPELFTGSPASVRSDLYALGLVLFEACTGRPLIAARTMDALHQMHRDDVPQGLTEGTRDVPAPLLRMIRACVDRDPSARPASALALSAMLPGTDPLNAAIAAGETPTPAMVAAASRVGALPLGTAWLLVIVGLIGLAVVAMTGSRATLIGRIAPAKSPAVLNERAQGILTELGLDRPDTDHAGFFTSDLVTLRSLVASMKSIDDWDHAVNLRPGTLVYVYRQSRTPLYTTRVTIRPFGAAETGRVTTNDPPTTQPGMVDVLLDTDGRFIGLRAMIEPGDSGSTSIVDWAALLRRAGFDERTLTVSEVQHTIGVDTDERRAWQGAFIDQPSVIVQIEAASLRGQPVWLAIHPASGSGRHEFTTAEVSSRDLGATQIMAITTMMLVSIAMWVAIALLVQRNLGLGRADRNGAWRLTLFLGVTALIAQMFRADHVSAPFEEIGLITNLAAQVAVYGVVNWLLYIALEPIARRRWPELLVGWNRLLAGRWRDALVGREMLIGALCGVLMTGVIHAGVVMPAYFGWPGEMPHATVISTLSATRHMAYFGLWNPNAAVVLAFGALLAYLINRSLLRHALPAMVLLFVCLHLGFAALTGVSSVLSISGALFTMVFLLALFRGGLLCAAIAMYGFLWLDAVPWAAGAGFWFADRMWIGLALVVSMIVFGAYVALDGKSPLGRWLSTQDTES